METLGSRAIPSHVLTYRTRYGPPKFWGNTMNVRNSCKLRFPVDFGGPVSVQEYVVAFEILILLAAAPLLPRTPSWGKFLARSHNPASIFNELTSTHNFKKSPYPGTEPGTLSTFLQKPQNLPRWRVKFEVVSMLLLSKF